jgi:hypothetical protein
MFLLMAQYNGAAIVPLEVVCRDFFSHLTVEKLLRKALRGEIALPIVRIVRSQKAHRGVHLADLADYIDKRELRPSRNAGSSPAKAEDERSAIDLKWSLFSRPHHQKGLPIWKK